MNAIDLADASVEEFQAYVAGYQDAIADAADRCRRNADAIADLEQQLADARADAAYWERVANPPRTAGPSTAELGRAREHAPSTPTTVSWGGAPVAQPRNRAS